MAPSSSRQRPAAFDRFTDASASAISSGYSAVLALGPQPKGAPLLSNDSQEGVNWLKNLKQFSGMYDGSPGSGLYIGDPSGENHDNSDEDEDLESDLERQPPKKKTKGTNSNGAKSKRNSKGAIGTVTSSTNDGKEKDSAAASRKAQNRLAQREFRQRKQQYIRALETRVELMSSDHDTQVDRLRFALRGLLAENNQLRQIVSGFASFVGLKQIGGPLQQAGVSREELEYLITNSAEKVMTEVWQHWPGAKECETLRQLRLESNLPPEGLPESNKLPEFGGDPSKKNSQSTAIKSAAATAMTAAQAQSQTRATASASPTSSTTKTTTASPSTIPSNGKIPKNGKMKSEIGKGSKKRKDYENESQQSSSTQPLDSSTSVSVAAAGFNEKANDVPFPLPSNNSQVLASFFNDGNNLLQQQQQQNDLVTTPSAFTFTPTFTGLTTPSLVGGGAGGNMLQPQNQHQQESNALLASLFGTSGMSGFITPGGGQSQNNGLNPFSNPQQNPFAQQPLPQAQSQQQLNRQKVTIANAEESEEIQRIDRLINQLKREYNRYGSGREPKELEEIGERLHELINHMTNFRRQPSYHLPLVLRPSEIQQTRPHDPLIDALPFPGIRQNIIAQQESLVIEDVILNILQYCKIHHSTTSPNGSPSQNNNNEDDFNDEQNWELLYGFLIAYPQLVDQHTLDIANRWRASRKESILSFDDLTLRQV